MLAGDVVISEFVAANTGSLQDVYGNSPDWIELHNRGNTSVDLLGYHLTDRASDPVGWTFNSSSVIGPGEHKVVFASGRNEIDPAGYFHTDFSLSAGGEYLALYDSNGILRTEFGNAGANYPPQITDISYGISGGTLVNSTSIAQYWIPTSSNFSSTWRNNNFDATASGFSTGRAAIGYENEPGSSTSFVGHFLTSVPSGTTSVYLRNEFYLTNASAISNLVFSAKYDDGFAVYLNGAFLLSRNAGNGLAWNATASASHNDADALQYESFALDGSPGSAGNFLSLLQNGKNTLAIHALNTANSSDFLMSPRLTSSSLGGIVSYLQTPTPGQTNSQAAALGPRIENVTPSGTVINPGQSITISAKVSVFDLPVNTASVTLRYRVMYGNEIVVSMNDNGIGADAVAGDGIYSATLNSASVPAGQMVRWYVTAQDTAGRLTRAPRFFDPLNSSEYFGSVVTDASINTDLQLLQWFIQNPAAANTFTGSRASIFYNGTFYDNVQVDLHGQSTSLSEFLKKSYDFDANSGEKFRLNGIGPASDFNLLTNYADQTKLRHPLSYEVLAQAGVPTLIGNAVTVYRNGSFYALYDLIEESGEEYLTRVGLDPNAALYKVNNPLNSAYNEVSKRTRKYEDHSDLQKLINANALSGSAATTWDFDNIDVADWVNYLAAESIVANSDFGLKNMNWYRDTNGTGLWTPLPWDQDLTFGHRWEASVNPPYFDNTLYSTQSITPGLNSLFQRVYSNSVLRNMFFRRLKTLSDQFYGAAGSSVASSYVYQRLNQIQSSLADEIQQDMNAWGVHANFAAAFPFNPTQAIDQLRDVFINARRTFINNDSRVPSAQTGVPAILFDTSDYDSSPISGLQAEEYVRLNNPGSTAVDISDWKLTGGISHTFKSGTVIPAGGSLFVVKDVVAFKARNVGPRGGQQRFIQGNYQGDLSNLGETVNLFSKTGVFVHSLTVPASGLTPNQQFLRISEFNYNPHSSVNGGEFIEFLNTGSTTLNLSGVTISDGPSTPYAFPTGTMLAPSARILIVQDVVAFRAAYPAVNPAIIVGNYAGSLSNSGEKIQLKDFGGDSIVEIDYTDSDPWHFETDGDGLTMQLANEFSTSLVAMNKYYSWVPSVAFNGTPGTAPVLSSGIVINEILSHTDFPLVDSIELFNPTNQTILIGGMYLSDSANNLLKYQIPLGTVIGAGKYLVFDETHFNPNPANPGPNDFSLNAQEGDDVWLTTVQNGIPLAIQASVKFGPTFNGVSIARMPNGTGRLLPSLKTTLGTMNSAPRVGPLIISEVNYHPGPASPAALAIFPITEKNLEYIEITNPTLQTINLENWRLSGEVNFTFAAGTLLGPGASLIVVTFAPELSGNASQRDAFRAHYGINSSVRMFGSATTGNLNNSFGRVSLLRPDSPPANNPTLIPRVLVDEVVYDDLHPWPTQADGTGQSLHRIAAGILGTAASNWLAGSTSPGAANVQATVMTRSLFYNNSVFDGNSSTANAGDDLAQANNKSPLFNGQTATFENYTSYVHGINGIMIDVVGLRSTPALGDFLFANGNSDQTSSWVAAPNPISITVRPGDGPGSADRVSLVWADGAIVKTWLQVKVLIAGLPSSDVFYFGNVIGESGNEPANTIVNLLDVAVTREGQTGFTLTDINHPLDYNRDRRVNLSDIGIARQNQSGFSRVNLITPDGSSPATPGGIRHGDDLPPTNTSEFPLESADSPDTFLKSIPIFGSPPVVMPNQAISFSRAIVVASATKFEIAPLLSASSRMKLNAPWFNDRSSVSGERLIDSRSRVAKISETNRLTDRLFSRFKNQNDTINVGPSIDIQLFDAW